MKPLITLFFFIIFTSNTITTPTNANQNDDDDNNNNIIHQTCNTSSENDPNLNYNFCVTSLESYPISRYANLRQLGIISIKLLYLNVTNTRTYIKKLLKDHDHDHMDSFTRSCLVDCLEVYGDSLPTLKEAMKDYKSRKYNDVNIEVSSVLDASNTCEDGFMEKQNVVSPLSKRNNDTFQLSVITLSIVNMLH